MIEPAIHNRCHLPCVEGFDWSLVFLLLLDESASTYQGAGFSYLRYCFARQNPAESSKLPDKE